MRSMFSVPVLASVLAAAHGSCEFLLHQADFEFGTVRIAAGGDYCLAENVVFNPLSDCPDGPNSEGCYFPTDDTLFPGSTSFSDGAFALGFFAAITIEANDVTLDLRGFRIEFALEFYLQQRFGAVIEIANSPFIPGVGPADFGTIFEPVDNVVIENGVIGLTSHHSIHSNGASNVVIRDIQFVDFEVAAIQLNGFRATSLQNLEIGPSLSDVPLRAYYSNARFLLLALRKLVYATPSKKVIFAGDRELTLREIEQNLVSAMDIVFGVLAGRMDEADVPDNDLYQKAKALFINEGGLPDGSAIYGIVLNSNSVAIGGFGASANDQDEFGRDVTINNVQISGLRLAVNEVPALYFDKCSDAAATSTSAQKGPFGELFDLRLVVNEADAALIEQHGQDAASMMDIDYVGNPLADAQIALAIHGDSSSIPYTFGTFISSELIEWASGNSNFPSACADFVCNADNMLHQNKGVIGLRMDGIEEALIIGLSISNMSNESPLVSNACASYTGPNDGGLSGTIQDEGGMGTDVRGISVANGDALVIGRSSLDSLHSWYGDTVGLDLIGASVFEFDTGSDLEMSDLRSGTKVSAADFEQLTQDGRTPFPNNFDLCSVRYAETARVTGHVPDDKAATDCVYNGLVSGPSNCSHPENIYDVMIVASWDGTYPGSAATHQSREMPAERNTFELRSAAYEFFRTHYGFAFDANIEGFQSLFDENGALLVSVAATQVAVPYRINAFDDQTGRTSFQQRMQITNAQFDDVSYALVVHQNIAPLPTHEVDYGVDSISVGQTVVYGSYRILIDGVPDQSVMPDIIFHTSYGEVITMGAAFPFMCAVEHPWYGEGQVFGVMTMRDNDDNTFTVRTSAVHTYPAKLSDAEGKYSDNQCRDL